MARKITEIILHCSATKEGQNYKASDIDRWHKNQGWKCIGYNYVIDLDGTVEKGRDIDDIPAHCTGHNKNSIGICYIGGCDVNNKAKDTRTQQQKESMYKLVHDLLNKYHLTINDVYGHYTFSKKSCPCFTNETFRKEYNDYYSKEIVCPFCGHVIKDN